MNTQKEYAINEETWQKLRHTYNKLILLNTPFIAIVFSFGVWAITDRIFMISTIMVPFLIIYLFALTLYKKFYCQSTYSLLLAFLVISSIPYYFLVIGYTCIFCLFSKEVFYVHGILMLLAVGYFSFRYYKNWRHNWNKHKFHNENSVLDLKNGRYDFLNHFDISEKGKKKNSLSMSVISLVLFLAPLATGLGTMFSQSGHYNYTFIIIWICSIPAAIGFTQPSVSLLFNFITLRTYEKQLGKPIINGLLK